MKYKDRTLQHNELRDLIDLSNSKTEAQDKYMKKENMYKKKVHKYQSQKPLEDHDRID